MVELRRHSRVPLEIEVDFIPKGGASASKGQAKDISVGGMLVEAEKPLGFGAELVVHVKLPGQAGTLALPGVIRWVRPSGMGVQFGLLGARETHAITEYIASKET
jgi:type IV pilus assembly protein PilZ